MEMMELKKINKGWFLFPLICIFLIFITSCTKKITQTYTVTWLNEDGSILEIDEGVIENSTPSFDSSTPTKKSTDSEDFEFSGWSPELQSVSSDTTYTAQFTASIRTFTVYWRNKDNSILEVDENVPYGTIPTYDSQTPTVQPNSVLYGFNCWYPAIAL